MVRHSPDQFSRRAVEVDGSTKIESRCSACGATIVGSHLREPDISEAEEKHIRECPLEDEAYGIGFDLRRAANSLGDAQHFSHARPECFTCPRYQRNACRRLSLRTMLQPEIKERRAGLSRSQG
jgi:hypothetical protein